MVNPGLAVSGWGSFVENPLRCIRTKPHTLGKNIAFAPIIEDLLLKGYKVEGGDRIKRHPVTVHGARQGSYARHILERNWGLTLSVLIIGPAGATLRAPRP